MVLPNTNMKYAITDKQTNEFYPDPTYDTIEKAMIKIDYLNDYRIKNDMPIRHYGVEALTDARLSQHDTEWKRYVSMID